MSTEPSNFMKRRMMEQKLWKPSKRYPEFEVSNYGDVRKRGERNNIKPTFDAHNKQFRVVLETVNGKAQVNLGSLVAECFIGERPANKKVAFTNNKPEEITSYTASNIVYLPFKYPPTYTKTKTATQEIEPEPVPVEDIRTLAQAMTQSGLEPQYIVLDVGAIAMTVSLEMARGIAGIQRLDIYRLKKHGTGNMTVWVLGDKLD